MKKAINIALTVSIINLYCLPILAEQLDQNYNINSQITGQAIHQPGQLRPWVKPPPEPPYDPKGKPLPPNPPSPPVPQADSSIVNAGSGSFNIIPVSLGASVPLVIGSGLLALYMTRPKNALLLPTLTSLNPPVIVQPDPTATTYSFDYGEPVQYNLLFKSSPKNPIYSDSVMYIKIPTWLEYIPQTVTFNNKLLTDKQDEDILTWYPDESMLIVQMGNVKVNQDVAISFGAKVLTGTVAKKEAFCMVKFQSVSNEFETDWHQMSVDPYQQLPVQLERVLQSAR